MKNSKFPFRFINYGLLVLAIVFRIYLYLQNRSFTIDEANLALNIIEKNGLDFFKSLDYLQYAPPLFLYIQKGLIGIFGTHEFSLRIFPLLCGIAACFLFYNIGKKWIQEKYLIFPLALFSFSELFVRYASENKAYSTDLFVTLFLLYAVLTFPLKNSLKSIFIWLFLGSIAVWLSMPSVFILFGIGVYFFFQAYQKEAYQLHVFAVLIPLIWAINFLFYYLGSLSNDIWASNLQEYHADYFLDWTSPKKILRSFQLFFDEMIGHTTIAIIFRALIIPMGIYALWKKSMWQTFLLLSPILICLICASFQMYSLIPRLIIFLIPLVLIIIGMGFQFAMEKSPKYGQYALIGIATLLTVNHSAIKFLKSKLETDVIKPSLLYVKEAKAQNDQVYLFHKGMPAYTFYSKYHESKDRFLLENIQIGTWNDQKKDIIKSKSGKTYVIGLHLESDDLKRLHQNFDELKVHKIIQSETIFLQE